jgi:predicted nucleotidyltransferase
MKVLDERLTQLRDLCRINHVKTLFAFGSVLRDADFNAESDIDLVVDFAEEDPIQYAENYFNLKFQLEELFNRPIDLLEERAIKNPLFRRKLNQSRMLIYG